MIEKDNNRCQIDRKMTKMTTIDDKMDCKMKRLEMTTINDKSIAK